MTIAEQTNLRLLPVIRRARGYHLYDASGRRILDLFQDGGRAWLGHRPDGVSLQFKNTLSRGVYAPFPSPEEVKMIKAVKILCKTLGADSDNTAYYRCGSAEAEKLGKPVDVLENEGASFVLWRPGLPWPLKASTVELLIPLPGLDAGRIIVSSEKELPPGDLPSPLIAAALNRCIWSLNNHLEGQSAGSPALFSMTEGWKQTGSYCFWQGSAEDYDIMFQSALKEGLLLAPSREIPCIIPQELSSGDLGLLKKIFSGGTAQ
ncbi:MULTISPECIES: aminotransferase class III-fold pyridoxal phosphate-dependent enzyme [unclassified Oceanispirochaeta]|uniref:aminotransferase class III-fold pyridoxal phosphate-dependent enzyme n=1 Tax=unclassified Oceanispirochaeta TaxID=2635722 RepID=UPI000E0947EE|nr:MULTISPECIES: aminotransferase class III-fold pyridoxal phosphate-dependent enzyme [unclassified Oceanispirochaeta]MBF9014177.1 aminotransferase class III-fold pyridoxal phosphate-dependent enzyme [Oceanispirochaeta sp. M2]NPD70667.1 aminotransferase class III-fold pyridoxal phosphate-dependent enzyme [Oceanispirochaeta sp. M1]RDG34428.1 aminotransferase class III-fold pyridoxal phosphate-dependent enzyme [Oceanispirochaeta sp. M1]